MTFPLVLLVIAAAIALAYGVTLMRARKTVARALMKTIPVALLAVTALAAGASPLFVAALAFCAAGDWFLAFDGE
ncbi:MAG: lysoplasmalogenase, partial [Nitratireductor sp.]|nr:lysoplasmalogenase [Nitratireductor sp.]